jgi:hypothetical protein
MTINIGNEEITKNESGMECGIVLPKDKYDHAIDYLTANPEEIYEAWASPGAYEGRGGELFGFVAPDWTDCSASAKYEGMRSGTCGCLQQIRAAKVEDGKDGTSGHAAMAYWNRLWDLIASDRRIPVSGSDITVEDLPVFAEWQREVDEKRKQDGFL